MSYPHRKKKRAAAEVELNLAAMLDMAFQLLTFFILTFKPAPVEGDVIMHMPPPIPTTRAEKAENAGENKNNANPVQGLTSLVVTVVSNDSGGLEAIAVGENSVGLVDGLAARLKALFGDAGAGFDQILIQVDSRLQYDGLMQVIDVCTRQKLPNGKKLSKLSFVELGGK
jgi:biopolymer transport protein ExbD